MARKHWNRWFFASRRGQIITLLRRSSRTVDELAQELNLTHTAVRTHLAVLVVEATSNSFADLLIVENYATSHAQVASNSWE